MIYVLSDIHGNMKRFDSIMEQINLKPEETLYVLGDVIDRYPDGIKILKSVCFRKNRGHTDFLFCHRFVISVLIK